MSQHLSRSDRPRLAVTTVVHREHAALLAQVDGLSMSTWPPDLHVTVAASDRELARNRLPIRSDRWETLVPRLQVTRQQPGHAFADAVMLAGDEAVAAGGQVLVHLDVRCIPERDLLQTYAERALETEDSTPVLWHADTVQLAPPGGLGYPVAGGMDRWATSAPVPVPEGPTTGPSVPWSTSFAILAEHWPVVREAWARLTDDAGPEVTLADAVMSLGGRCARAPGAVVYRQHPQAAAARYVAAAGDLPVADGPVA